MYSTVAYYTWQFHFCDKKDSQYTIFLHRIVIDD